MKSVLLDALASIDDPVKKRAVFVAILSRQIVDQGAEMPIVVGGALDLEYLQQRAEAEGIEDELQELLSL